MTTAWTKDSEGFTTVLVDSGNILYRSSNPAHVSSQARIKAAAIQQSYTMIGYDAMAVGPADLAGGLADLVSSAHHGIPWISANIRDQQNLPVLPPWKKVVKDNLKIAIIGLTADTTPLAEYSIVQWQQVLPEVLDQLYPTSDFIILLSSLDDAENTEIALSFPSIHLIISANPKSGNKVPQIINNSLIAQTHSRGKYFGRLIIGWSGMPIWEKADKQKVAAQLVSSYPDKKHNFSADTETSTATAGDFTSRYIALNKSIPEDEKVKEFLDQYQKKVYLKNKELSAYHSADSLSGGNFPASTSCVECHQLQTVFWQSTGHARAYETLANKQQQYNLDCLPCHVSWDISINREDTMTNLLALPSGRRSVNCGMCHGNLEAHLNDAANSPEQGVSEATCRQCHTVEMDNSFDFDKKVQQIRCPASPAG